MKISCIDLSFGENLITGNLFTLRCLLKKEIFIIKIHFVTGLRIFRPENKYCFVVQLLSRLRLFFMTPWTVACQAPLSMRFSRQEYWSGLPFPFPENIPNPGMEPQTPTLAGRLFSTESLMKPIKNKYYINLNAQIASSICQEFSVCYFSSRNIPTILAGLNWGIKLSLSIPGGLGPGILWIPNSADAQALYIKLCGICI